MPNFFSRKRPPASPTILAALLVLLASGCASLPGPPDPRDPLEPINRTIYSFNETLDKIALKPLATVYSEVAPPPVRGGATSFFNNFADFVTVFNDVFQLKLKQAAADAGRVAINSTIGMLGIFDVATRIGLERHREDFGQTLGYWGVPEGPYIVLPLLGPSDVRDGLGLLVDIQLDPEWLIVENRVTRYTLVGLRIINARANLLEAERVFDEVAVDRYAFLRDAYLQRRRNLVYDGNPPEDKRAPKRKTLKEMEEELELDYPASEPAPATQ